MNQYEEALKYFGRALQIKERATNDPETDTGLVLSFHRTGQCLLYKDQYGKALFCFQKNLQIQERFTNNAEIHEDFRLTLENLGQCLLKLGRDVEGREYLKKSRLINEHVVETNK